MDFILKKTCAYNVFNKIINEQPNNLKKLLDVNTFEFYLTDFIHDYGLEKKVYNDPEFIKNCPDIFAVPILTYHKGECMSLDKDVEIGYINWENHDMMRKLITRYYNFKITELNCESVKKFIKDNFVYILSHGCTKFLSTIVANEHI